MLKRVRIEVEGVTAAAALAALDKYEHALQAVENELYALVPGEDGPQFSKWEVTVAQRSFANEELSREVTDEVVEYAPNDVAFFQVAEDGRQSDWVPGGWKARRVVVYRDGSHRKLSDFVPSPRVVDHHEDRTTYPDTGTDGVNVAYEGNVR